jgi:hypothetical protein
MFIALLLARGNNCVQRQNFLITPEAIAIPEEVDEPTIVWRFLPDACCFGGSLPVCRPGDCMT